ncbi:hypothetical protein TNCT_622781 [Trichonephila clavata]|uniref:Uncharacterized protein n=1 Tax=Trichonephila clavata TaxID=2740835 RepID=A0A8X6GF26_TRICU|nr:hypothetical protein TNCT_622781 [Trichonephila clavata]
MLLGFRSGPCVRFPLCPTVELLFPSKSLPVLDSPPKHTHENPQMGQQASFKEGGGGALAALRWILVPEIGSVRRVYAAVAQSLPDIALSRTKAQDVGPAFWITWSLSNSRQQVRPHCNSLPTGIVTLPSAVRILLRAVLVISSVRGCSSVW